MPHTERQQCACKHENVRVLVGYPPSAQQQHQEGPGGQAECQAHQQAQPELRDRSEPRVQMVLLEPLVAEQRYEHADDVDEDTFPVEHVVQALFDLHAPEQRRDHGGPGDDDETAHQEADPERQAKREVHGDRRDPPGDQRAQREQAFDDGGRAIVALSVEGETALEQDDRYDDRDDGLQAVTEATWTYPAEAFGAQRYPTSEQEDDGRHPHAVSDEDECDTGGCSQAKGNQRIVRGYLRGGGGEGA